MLFKDIIGQKKLKSHFINEINSGKISHAKLLLGNNGNGTLPLVLGFIQYLFCTNRLTDDSCGMCHSCLKNQKLEHPDVHYTFPVVLAIDKKSNYFLSTWREIIQKISYFNLNKWNNEIDEKGRQSIIGNEEGHEIIKKLGLKSFEGGFKVIVIWMAETMNESCSNRLLKILEEPPNKTLFFLISESSETILPTILSRTQLINVPAIEFDALHIYLEKNHEIPKSMAISIASQAEGSYIEALDLLGSTHEEKDLNRDLFVNMMRVSYKKDVLAMISWADEISTQGKEKQKIFLRYALHMFRQSILKNYTENQLTSISREEEEFLNKFSQFITGSNINDFMNYFNDAHYHLERNANSKILFTELCFKTMRFIHLG